MRIFETHAHYDDEAFDSDRNELLRSLPKQGVCRVVNIGSNMESSRNTVRLTEEYDFFYGAVGVHPSDTGNLSESDIGELCQMTKSDKIVAIGEIGLDYHYDEPERTVQQKWFIRQAELARELNLPIVVHSRDAAEDTLRIMKEFHAEEIGGVIHCYSYSKELAKEFLDMGFYFGIGGVLTFQNARKLVETVEYLPLDRIVLETDSPYLAPVPYRGKRNTSLYLFYVLRKIAELKGISEEKTAEITYENACRLYRLT